MGVAGRKEKLSQRRRSFSAGCNVSSKLRRKLGRHWQRLASWAPFFEQVVFLEMQRMQVAALRSSSYRALLAAVGFALRHCLCAHAHRKSFECVFDNFALSSAMGGLSWWF